MDDDILCSFFWIQVEFYRPNRIPKRILLFQVSYILKHGSITMVKNSYLVIISSYYLMMNLYLIQYMKYLAFSLKLYGVAFSLPSG